MCVQGQMDHIQVAVLWRQRPPPYERGESIIHFFLCFLLVATLFVFFFGTTGRNRKFNLAHKVWFLKKAQFINNRGRFLQKKRCLFPQILQQNCNFTVQ